MRRSPAGVLGNLILILATALVLYVGGFLFFHYSGLMDVAKSPPNAQTGAWLYRFFKPLEDVWPW